MTTPTPVSGFFEGERLELTWRYAYRPEFMPLLVEYLGAQPGTRILDAGCGSGFLSRLLARALDGVQIVGLDADEKMLALARQMVEREGLAAQVELRPGNGRIPVDEAAAYALARQQKELDGLIEMQKKHGQQLAQDGFSQAEFEELIALKRARLAYLQDDPARAREVMEVFSEPVIIVRGAKPPR